MALINSACDQALDIYRYFASFDESHGGIAIINVCKRDQIDRNQHGHSEGRIGDSNRKIIYTILYVFNFDTVRAFSFCRRFSFNTSFDIASLTTL
jgi:hypothetical protein